MDYDFNKLEKETLEELTSKLGSSSSEAFTKAIMNISAKVFRVMLEKFSKDNPQYFSKDSQ